ncbi:D-arabinitol 4-dehydrogenase [Shimia isoporae]|uniref:D-arabinitol 4-dehydrogenase n=1 Tax=Shimia isoporae TaxID=647720 RepID=A0A4R1N0F9_9RHOB|nr:mannitol dehydrogenase family protein [Shimia isoporae]TCK99275.1 D-arabinitol 4-dehydrogenase [Shimia isoporae]
MTPTLSRSTYDISACQPGIVHLGYGAFHRAHQAVFVDAYMQETGDLRWGIVPVNLRASEAGAFATMQQGGDGYVLKTTSPEGQVTFQLVRAHIGAADWSKNAEAAENLLDLPSVHAVTITVTESGYYLDDANEVLNLSDPVIAAEINGGNPKSVYGFLANALQRRASGNGQPITIMCCDNIRGNGRMLQRSLLSYLFATDRADLANWVQANASFPNSMVDRITPRAAAHLAAEVAKHFPDHASSPVSGEAFIQWVLEDNFAGPMPDLPRAGVEVVADVDPFEEAKIRILNGGHSGLCYLGALAGHTTFDAAMHDPSLLPHFEGWEFENILPGLTLDLPFDKEAYTREVAARFGNIAISDQLERICMDGWSKMPIYIRPTLASCLSQGILPTYGFDCVASWYVFARRSLSGTMPIPYHEPYWENLKPLLSEGQEEVFAITSALWGDLPALYSDFVPGIVSAIKRIEEQWPV